MSALPPLCGHAELQERFRRAAMADRLPQSLLLHGPDGVGKQRLGLWIGALVLCSARPEARPCGDCGPCRMVGGLQHPDLHWFFPLPRPKGSHSPKKLRELLEEARMEAIAERREDPLGVREHEKAPAIYLAMVDELRARASRRPATAESTVFVVGDAERMVPQAASQEAANAFLKLLEEPPPDTLLVLTSSRPGALLPTIRSRVLAVRVTPPDPEEAAAFLEKRAGLPGPTARELARRTQGAVGRALRLAGTDATDAEEGWRFVGTAATGTPTDRLALAACLPVSGARGPFTDTLDRIEEVLRECLTRATDSVDFAWHRDPGDRSDLLDVLARVPPDRLISCMDHVESARRAAAGNGNPQAIGAVLLSRLAHELQISRSGGRNAVRGRV
ncbi:MAG: ATP-binding protein [Gemmatimonadota bacterium]